MSYIIEFPIGDWSDDGHCKCKYFNVSSNKPVEYLREMHFKVADVLGINIGELCKEYECEELTDEQIEKLNSLNIDTKSFEESASEEDLLEIWLKLLMFIDKKLILKVITVKKDTINFYGFDEKKRHLGTPGYGLF